MPAQAAAACVAYGYATSTYSPEFSFTMWNFEVIAWSLRCWHSAIAVASSARWDEGDDEFEPGWMWTGSGADHACYPSRMEVGRAS